MFDLSDVAARPRIQAPDHHPEAPRLHIETANGSTFTLGSQGLALDADAAAALTRPFTVTETRALTETTLPGRLGANTVALLLPTPDTRQNGVSALLVLARAATREGSVRVLVNGFPALPVTLLEDRAEVSIESATFLFRATSSNTTRAFEATRAATCARCKRPLFAGDAVRACRHCGGDHHDGPRSNKDQEPLGCHSYDRKCARCGSDLAAASPEED